MAGTILTPSAIWSKVEIDRNLGVEIIEERNVGDVSLSKIYVDGQEVGGERVKIAGTLARTIQHAIGPAILMVEDFESGTDESEIIDLAKRGYAVLSIDIAGKKEGKEFFTSYPQCISYSNYEQVKDDMLKIEGAVTNTCYYQWCLAVRYALSYLKSQPDVVKVGGIGLGLSGTALWQTAGTDKNLDCLVMGLNGGWLGYAGIEKFCGKAEPQFSDDMYKFIAGVEPQAYAMHIECPTLLLVATNSEKFDVDRAYDTISRIDEKVYSAIHYSVGYNSKVCGAGYNDLLIFIDKYLSESQGTSNLPEMGEIKCEVIDGDLSFELETDNGDIKDMSVYVSEEITDPSKRCWHHLRKGEYKDGKYTFKYYPYCKSGLVTAFAQATYKSGFSIGTNVIAKRFEEDELKCSGKVNIIYSSRDKNGESIFGSAHIDSEKENRINVADKKLIQVKKGPMGIEGVTCKHGLATYKVLAEKYHPQEDSMLMLDVYTKTGGTLIVILGCESAEGYVEYCTNVNLIGGDVWHNVKIEQSRFKTAEGMPLKSYENVSVLKIHVGESEYLINNALWV